MSAEQANTGPAGISAAEAEKGWHFVARQPVLDRLGRVQAYCLLSRTSPGATLSGDREQATRTLIDNALVFGIEPLTHGALAFVSCTSEALQQRFVEVLPAAHTVLHLHGDASPTPELIAAFQELKVAGFRLSLGANCVQPGFERLIELADYIKMDFAALDAAKRHFLQTHGLSMMAGLIAERVETQADFRRACQEGFGLFQGYYFCRPEVIKNRKAPANRLSQIRILELLQRESVDLQEIAKWVKQDTSLTYRLLRLVNSPVCAVRQEVSSIESALMMVGEQMFRRMATLAISSAMNSGNSAEILRMAFARARFCELTSKQGALNHSEQYLLGLFSMLPAMLNVAMDELTPTLPLREPIRAALHGTLNLERASLQWLELQELGNWAACDGIAQEYGLDRNALSNAYAEAAGWAEETLRVVL